MHIEKHRGYRGRFSIRPVPKAGDVVMDGGQRVWLQRCRACGDGLLAVPLAALDGGGDD